MSHTPTILCIGGHDPTGGAGIQADIETATALGCRAYSVVTCLTTQDTHNVQHIYPQSTLHFSTQLKVLLADITPDAIKIGLIGTVELIETLAAILPTLNTPVVFDPILKAGGGKNLADDNLTATLCKQLLPFTTLLTPNRAEARRLGGHIDLHKAATQLLKQGCQHVLLTGADESQGSQVKNILYSPHNHQKDFICEKLPHHYHGSGCTLASACASGLAQGKNMLDAVQAAQAFTYKSLQRAEQPGCGQYLPMRFKGSLKYV